MSRSSSGLHPQKENQSSWFSKMESRLLGVPSGLGWLIGKAYNPLSHFVWRMDQSWTLLLGGMTFQNIPQEREQHISIFCANASPIEPTCLLLHQGLNHHTSGLKVLHSSLIIFSRGISFLSENLGQCLYPVLHRNNIEVRYEDTKQCKANYWAITSLSQKPCCSDSHTHTSYGTYGHLQRTVRWCLQRTAVTAPS